MKKLFSIFVLFLIGVLLISCSPDDKPLIITIKDNLAITFAEGDTKDTVTQNFSVVTQVGDATIQWLSTNPSVISFAGSSATVTRSSSDVTVIVTAMISLNGESESKGFQVIVLGTGEQEPEDQFTLWYHFEFPFNDLNHGYSDSAVDADITNSVSNTQFDVKKRRANTGGNGEGLILSGASASESVAWLEFVFAEGVSKITFDARFWSELDVAAVIEASFQVKDGANWVTLVNLVTETNGSISFVPVVIEDLEDTEFRFYVNANVGTQNTARLVIDDMKVYGVGELEFDPTPNPDPDPDPDPNPDPNEELEEGQGRSTFTSIYTSAQQSLLLSTGDVTQHFTTTNNIGVATFTVLYSANNAQTHNIFNNAAGEFRLYPGSTNGNSITINISAGFVVESIVITFGIQNAGLSVNGSAADTTISGEKEFTFDPEVTSIVLQNVVNLASGGRIDIKSVVITYREVE